ncbi:hypothetical protein [Nostoc sp.]|uniref:hypothetical protein n=1 Tax=Nostoc sp. TaxID=1180 RepID=UPI002FF7D66C
MLTPTIAIRTSVIDSGWVKIALAKPAVGVRVACRRQASRREGIADNGIGMSEQI